MLNFLIIIGSWIKIPKVFFNKILLRLLAFMLMTSKFSFSNLLVGCSKQNNASTPKYVHVLLFVTCDHSTLLGKRKFFYVINIKKI